MDIELLSEYIEFSKSLSISTAAKSLFISQSTLSKHLKSLEGNVGAPLIDRTLPSGLKLTEAGKVFLDACSVITHTYDNALEKCHLLSRSPKRISILKPCTIDGSIELIYEVFRNMQRDHEEISVELLQMGGYSMVENLIMGRVDCSTQHSNSPEQRDMLKEQGISLFPLFEDNIYAWIPTSSELSTKQRLFLEDLIDVPILVPASRVYMDMHEWIQSLCAKAGFKPLLAYKDVEDMYELMNSNLKDGVMILTSEATMGDPVIKMQTSMIIKPLEDKGLKNLVSLAYRADNANPALQTLIECIKAHSYPILEDKQIIDVIKR